MDTNKIVGRRIFYRGDMSNPEAYGTIIEARSNPVGATMVCLTDMERIDNTAQAVIILDDGRRIGPIPVGMIKDGGAERFQWAKEPAVDARGIAQAHARAATYKAAQTAKKQAEQAAMVKARQMALNEGLAMGLIPARVFNGRGTPAAANLRKELGKAGIKAAVRGNVRTIRVRVNRPEDLEAASKIGAKYEAGYFDGMNDIYREKTSAWGSVFGDVEYVIVQGA